MSKKLKISDKVIIKKKHKNKKKYKCVNCEYPVSSPNSLCGECSCEEDCCWDG